jgi:hypothetical protein
MKNNKSKNLKDVKNLREFLEYLDNLPSLKFNAIKEFIYSFANIHRWVDTPEELKQLNEKIKIISEKIELEKEKLIKAAQEERAKFARDMIVASIDVTQDSYSRTEVREILANITYIEDMCSTPITI